MGPEGGGVAPGGWSTQKINAVQRGNNKIIKKKNVEQSTAARVEISFSFSFLFFFVLFENLVVSFALFC